MRDYFFVFVVLIGFLFTICLSGIEPGFSGIEGANEDQTPQELRVNAEEAARTERARNLEFKNSTHLDLALDIGRLTHLYMEAENSGDQEPFFDFAKDVGQKIDTDTRLEELSQIYQTAPPNVRDALDPVLKTLEGKTKPKTVDSGTHFATQSLIEFSDLWALPVFKRNFPGYGKRKLWLKYKRGRLTRSETGQQDIRDKESSIKVNHDQELLVPESLLNELRKRYPKAVFLKREMALDEEGEITVLRFRVSLNKGDHLQLKKVEKTRFDWYRLIASPTGMTILPIYVKVGEYYVSREVKNSKFFLIGF